MRSRLRGSRRTGRRSTPARLVPCLSRSDRRRLAVANVLLVPGGKRRPAATAETLLDPKSVTSLRPSRWNVEPGSRVFVAPSRRWQPRLAGLVPEGRESVGRAARRMLQAARRDARRSRLLRAYSGGICRRARSGRRAPTSPRSIFVSPHWSQASGGYQSSLISRFSSMETGAVRYALYSPRW